MTKLEIISALESFKDAVSEERQHRLSEIQASVQALLEKVEEKPGEPAIALEDWPGGAAELPKTEALEDFIPTNVKEKKAKKEKKIVKHRKK